LAYLRTRLKSAGLSGFIQTSYVERINLTLRHCVSFLARRTWGLAWSQDTLMAGEIVRLSYPRGSGLENGPTGTLPHSQPDDGKCGITSYEGIDDLHRREAVLKVAQTVGFKEKNFFGRSLAYTMHLEKSDG
jgi:hypothetical protein